MPKISKSLIITIAFLTLLFLVNALLLDPAIKTKYLSTDIKSFKEYSWKYTLLLSLFIVVLLFLKQKKFNFTQTLNALPYILFFGIAFYMGFKNLIDKCLLYANTKTEKKEWVRTFEVIHHKDHKVFWLSAGKNSIHDDELFLINERRIKKNLKSIFDYDNGDTIKVKFKTGMLNVNYLD
ncbi:hypothetical protein CHRYSEOSP005_23100 [Chryseobacterium sp. Alg-005]|uniref:hypothetical protein n=1 Tax=Chryseobacterium sp. Alg-005 TaxID=3159516 RepID=UPI003555758B